MTPVELQIVRAILIEQDRELEHFRFVDYPQAKGLGSLVITPADANRTVTELPEETATFYSVVRTPKKRISETRITFYRDQQRKTIFVVEQQVTLIETLIDRVRAVQARTP